jgi:hypothetical protein
MNPSRFAMSTRRSSGRIALIVSVVALLVTGTAAPAGADVSFINSRRSSAGLPAVTNSGGLASVAASHSRSMADRNTLGHSSNLGTKVSSVLPGWLAVGENVGVGTSMSAVNSMFMESSSHRANILGNYTHAGVGTYTGPDGRIWVTQVFARMPSSGTVAAASAPAPTTATSGGTTARRTTTTRASRSGTRTVAPAPPAPRVPLAIAGVAPNGTSGYAVVTDDGGVFTSGDAPFAGSAVDVARNARLVDADATDTGKGYILFAADGGVFTFGDASFAGSAAESSLNGPIVSGDITPTGRGYRLFGSDGGVLTFGDAVYYGGLVGAPLNAQVVAAGSTPSGRGYVLVARDGGVFVFGDLDFFGSLAGQVLNAPIVDVAVTRTGKGYWLVGADGGVFAFGDAPYLGGLSGSDRAAVAGIVPAASGKGYWLITQDKQATGFGDVQLPPELHGMPASRTTSTRV